jgi:hypothetical protein
LFPFGDYANIASTKQRWIAGASVGSRPLFSDDDLLYARVLLNQVTIQLVTLPISSRRVEGFRIVGILEILLGVKSLFSSKRKKKYLFANAALGQLLALNEDQLRAAIDGHSEAYAVLLEVLPNITEQEMRDVLGAIWGSLTSVVDEFGGVRRAAAVRGLPYPHAPSAAEPPPGPGGGFDESGERRRRREQRAWVPQ